MVHEGEHPTAARESVVRTDSHCASLRRRRHVQRIGNAAALMFKRPTSARFCMSSSSVASPTSAVVSVLSPSSGSGWLLGKLSRAMSFQDEDND